MERVALNEVELEILKSEIENGGTSIFLTILISMLFSLLFIFSHGKHNTPSLYDNYGFWKPFMIITAILTAIYSFHNQKEKSLIEKDLNSDKKTVEMKTVWKKDRPLSQISIVFGLTVTSKNSIILKSMKRNLMPLKKGIKLF
jgi:hypothetical protein